MARLLLISAAVIALAGASSVAQEPAPAAREALYMPTKVGTKRVYQHRRGKTAWETTNYVVAVRPNPAGGTVVSVSSEPRVITTKSVWSLRTYEVSDAGLSLTGVGSSLDRGLDRPLHLLKLPHSPGQTWVLDPPNSAPAVTAHGPERVEVPAGVFDCIRVEQRADGVVTETTWYARGVGQVKWVFHDPGEKDTALDYHVALKSFTPGKDHAP